MSIEQLSRFLSPPVRRALSDEITDRLRQAILNSHLAPDEPLRESQLASFMGVSRGPVREALKQLEREGLVINRSNGRSYVARLLTQDLEEVYSLRSALETLAVECACAKGTEIDLADMQAVVDDMAAHREDGLDEQEAAELDLRFHDILYRASQHGRLINFWTILRPQIYVFLLSRNVASADFRDDLVRGHQAILDAIRNGDPATAKALTTQHMNYAYNRVVRSYGPADPETR